MKSLKNKLYSLFHNREKNQSRQMTEMKKTSTLNGGVKHGFRIYATIVLTLTIMLSSGMTAFATNDPVTVVNNLSEFIFGLIRAIGLILLGFGIVQIGLSLKSHDPSQRANGFLTLAGGVIITFAKEILGIITGG